MSVTGQVAGGADPAARILVDAPTGRSIVEATTTNPSSGRGDEQRYNTMIDKINQLPTVNVSSDAANQLRTVRALPPASTDRPDRR